MIMTVKIDSRIVIPRQKVATDIKAVQQTKKYFFATFGKNKSVIIGLMILKERW